jgi:hypothetical protein
MVETAQACHEGIVRVRAAAASNIAAATVHDDEVGRAWLESDGMTSALVGRRTVLDLKS